MISACFKLICRRAFFVGLAAMLVWLLEPGCARKGGGLKQDLDVVYGEAGGQKLLIDIFRPQAITQPLPAILFVHGGGWSGGDKKSFRELAKGIAKQGYVTFSVNYRLVKGDRNRYPAQLDDEQRAVRWIRAQADQYGVNPAKVGALGASAGGHLVGLLGTLDTRDNSDATLAKFSSRVECVVDMFGPNDLTSDFSRNKIPGLDVQQLVNDLMGKPFKDAPQAYRDASPLFHVDKQTAPFLIFHGTVDPLVPVDQSQRLHDALQKAGVESKLIVFPGEGHGFAKKENLETFVMETRNFFDRHLKR